MSGAELYRAVRRCSPRSAARVVFMSVASAAEAVRETIDGALVQQGTIGVQTPMTPGTPSV